MLKITITETRTENRCQELRKRREKKHRTESGPRNVNTNVSRLYAQQDAKTPREDGERASRLSPYGADALKWVGPASRRAR
jgi:hypothetical protein